MDAPTLLNHAGGSRNGDQWDQCARVFQHCQRAEQVNIVNRFDIVNIVSIVNMVNIVNIVNECFNVVT